MIYLKLNIKYVILCFPLFFKYPVCCSRNRRVGGKTYCLQIGGLRMPGNRVPEMLRGHDSNTYHLSPKCNCLIVRRGRNAPDHEAYGHGPCGVAEVTVRGWSQQPRFSSYLTNNCVVHRKYLTISNESNSEVTVKTDR